MKAKRLTDAEIESADTRDKRYSKNDGGGLILFIYPCGKKTWTAVYRKAKKIVHEKIGEYPSLTLKLARETLARKKKARAMIEAIKPETFIDAAYLWLDMWKDRTKPSIKTIQTVLNRFKKHVFPVIGKKLLVEINKQDIENLLIAIQEQGLHPTAQYVLIYMRLVFRYALWRDACLHNPCDLIILSKVFQKYTSKNRPALKEEKDLKRLIESINELEDKRARYALVLMFFFATRTGELLRAKWEEFNLDEAVWIIPPERMKNRREHSVPLCDRSIECLKFLKRDIQEGEYLFFHPSKYQKNLIYNALNKMGYKGIHCGHGFRTSFSSRANKLKQGDKEEILAQLAHTEPNKTTQAYIREDYFDERRQLMQRWGDYLVSLGLNLC